jgi:hypothetical protein
MRKKSKTVSPPSEPALVRFYKNVSINSKPPCHW